MSKNPTKIKTLTAENLFGTDIDTLITDGAPVDAKPVDGKPVKKRTAKKSKATPAGDTPIIDIDAVKEVDAPTDAAANIAPTDIDVSPSVDADAQDTHAVTIEPSIEPTPPTEPPKSTSAPPFDVEPIDDYADSEGEPPGLDDAPLTVFNTPRGAVKQTAPPMQSLKDYHEACIKHFDNDACLHFLRSRGFVDADFDILRALRIGFDPNERRLILPHSDYDHTARTVADGKPKFKNPEGEKEPIATLFNAAAVTDHDICIVTEAAIDALSLIVCGIPAVAAHGTGGTITALLAAIDADPKRPRAVLIGFDNDKPGNDASDNLAADLDMRGILHDRVKPPSDIKDFNDWLKLDRNALIEGITSRIEHFRSELAHKKLIDAARNEPVTVLDHAAIDIITAPSPATANAVAFDEPTIIAAAEASDRFPAAFSIYRILIKQFGISLKTFDGLIKKHGRQTPRGAANANHNDYSILNQPLDVPPIVAVIKERLIRHKKSQAPVSCVKNFDIVFDFDPALKGVLGFNFFAQRIELTRVPDWYPPLLKSFFDRKGYQPTLGFVDSDDACLQNHIDRTYLIRSSEIFQRVVIERAHQNIFHPVQSYIQSLPPWDGTPRAERLFIDNLAADDNDYSRAVTLRWLVAAVSRVFYPACKFDYCLVLKGHQGIGKSTLLSMLGGQWYGELDSIQGKDSVENIQGRWIIELAEMQATRKADNEQIKAFISRQTDFVRLPYERRARPFPRQCVLAASTNDSEILRDQTGGRRFLILECKARMNDFSVKISADDIPQVWAEVYHIYNQWFADGFDDRKLDLPNNLKPIAQSLQEANTDGSDIRGLIEAFLNRPVPRYEFWRLCTKEERRNYCAGNVVYLPYSRIAQSKFKLPCSLDEVKDNCIELDDDGKKKCLLPLDGLGDKSYNDIDRRFIFGDGLRQKVSPIEILNECFDGERSRLVNNRKIADIMRTLDGWEFQPWAVNDPQYGRQATSFVRIDNDSPSEASESHANDTPPAARAFNEFEPVDSRDIPF